MISALVVCLWFASLSIFLPPVIWPLEVAQNFGFYWLLTLAALFGTRRWWGGRLSKTVRWAIFSALVLQILLLLNVIRPFYFRPSHPSSGPARTHFRVLSANVDSDNIDPRGVVALCRAYKPDVVALFESRRNFHSAVEATTHFEVSRFEPQVAEAGISLLSRYPLVPNTDIQTNFGDDVRPAIFARVQGPAGQPLALLAFDLLPPTSDDARYRNKLLSRRVATILRHEQAYPVVLSDLNATPYSATYQGFLDGAKLSDAMWGFGLLGTWTTHQPLLRLTLDHVMYREPLEVVNLERVSGFGSDHFGLVVDFAFPEGVRLGDPMP